MWLTARNRVANHVYSPAELTRASCKRGSNNDDQEYVLDFQRKRLALLDLVESP